MVTLGNIINDFRTKRNISMDKFSEMSGLSKGYISMLEKNINPKTGTNITPSLETYQAVSKAINIDFDDLIRAVDGNSEINLNNIPGISVMSYAKRIPIIGTIACGNPIFAQENYEGYFIADESIKADFVLKAKGDSMIDAEIYDGDLVFMKKVSDVENGKIAAVLITDEATLKKVVKSNDLVILQPCNINYKPILLDGTTDALILGEMIGVYHPIKNL